MPYQPTLQYGTQNKIWKEFFRTSQQTLPQAPQDVPNTKQKSPQNIIQLHSQHKKNNTGAEQKSPKGYEKDHQGKRM